MNEHKLTEQEYLFVMEKLKDCGEMFEVQKDLFVSIYEALKQLAINQEMNTKLLEIALKRGEA